MVLSQVILNEGPTRYVNSYHITNKREYVCKEKFRSVIDFEFDTLQKLSSTTDARKGSGSVMGEALKHSQERRECPSLRPELVSAIKP